MQVKSICMFDAQLQVAVTVSKHTRSALWMSLISVSGTISYMLCRLHESCKVCLPLSCGSH
jgi:hypothetical protein